MTDKSKKKGGVKLKAPSNTPVAESTGVKLGTKPKVIKDLSAIDDKPTREFLKTQTRLNPGFEAAKEEERLLAGFHIKNGNPKIRESPKEKRSHHNPLSNVAYLEKNRPEDYTAELAHAKQLKDKGLLKHSAHGVTSWFKSPYLEVGGDTYDKQYGIKGSQENDAHSKIEPALEKGLNKITSQAHKNVEFWDKVGTENREKLKQSKSNTMGIKMKKYADGTSGVSLTGKAVKKGKPVAKAYMDSKDVKQGGGNPLSVSKGGDPMKDSRDISGSVSGVGMKSSKAKAYVTAKYSKGTSGIKMKKK